MAQKSKKRKRDRLSVRSKKNPLKDMVGAVKPGAPNFKGLVALGEVAERRKADAAMNILAADPEKAAAARRRSAEKAEREKVKEWRDARRAERRHMHRPKRTDVLLPIEAEVLRVYPDGVVSMDQMMRCLAAVEVEWPRAQVISAMARIRKLRLSETVARYATGIEVGRNGNAHRTQEVLYRLIDPDGVAARDWCRWAHKRRLGGVRCPTFGTRGRYIPYWIRGQEFDFWRGSPHATGYLPGDPEDSPWPGLGLYGLSDEWEAP